MFRKHKSKPKPKTVCEPAADELRILVPIQDKAQGRLAVNVLTKNASPRLTLIRLFHCLENSPSRKVWVNPMEAIQSLDQQAERLEHMQVELQSFAQELAKAFPDARVTFHAIEHESIADAIKEEAEIVGANMILLVNDPHRKKHWLVPGISGRILRTAKCPVQIIKPSRGAQDDLVFVA